ncbi:hypothetical protein DOS84_11875 [Flavobacterium aquariorum]|uniref:Uncharacterized protein n=1 Tax=Flavobacterium aquariorum TaxID=2217670 RepID=A0A2W7VLJ5_9FLAO|nr:hypothetical protein DOS84_11875 [Flavobacterium aquariorum]
MCRGSAQKIETESGTTVDEISNVSAPNSINQTTISNNLKQHPSISNQTSKVIKGRSNKLAVPLRQLKGVN